MPFSLCYIKEDIDIEPDDPVNPSGEIPRPPDPPPQPPVPPYPEPEPEPDDGSDDDGSGSSSTLYVKFNNYPFEIAAESEDGEEIAYESFSGKIKLSRIYKRPLINGEFQKIPDNQRQYDSEVFEVDGAKVQLTLDGMKNNTWDWTLIISPAPNEGATKWITAIDEFLSSTTDANPKGATGRNNMIEIV